MDKLNDTMTFPSIDADTVINETIVINTPERIKRRRYFKREARHIIFKNGNWYKLIFAAMFMTLSSVSVNYICGSFFTIVNIINTPIAEYAASYLTDIVYLAVMIPFIHGLYRYSKCLMENESPRFGVIFDIYGSVSSLVRSYKIFFTYLWRYFIFIALVYAGLKTTDIYAVSGLILVASLAGIIVFIFCGVIFLQRYYLTAYTALCNEEMTVRESVKHGIPLMKGYRFDVFAFQFGFMGWLVVSYLTLGITAILFAIPYYILANLEFAKFIYKEKENVNNE